MAAEFDLDAVIRKVPDFPKPGILFYDVTGILVHPRAFAYCVEVACQRYAAAGLDAIAAIDARGFVFASPIAYKMKLPLILVRKNGKLPGRTIKRRFALEYGEDTVEVHRADVKAGQKVLIVDDLIATGGTLKAAGDILAEAGAVVSGIFAIIGLPFLNYHNVLAGHEIVTLIDYHSEHIE